MEKFKPNYKYRIFSRVEVESRISFIKSLRATALYMEEEVTDEQFHTMALAGEAFPKIDTYKIEELTKI